MRYDRADDRLYGVELWTRTGELVADITGITPRFSYGLRRNRPESIELTVDRLAAKTLAADIGMTTRELFAGYEHDIRLRRGNRYLLGAELAYTEPTLGPDASTRQVRGRGFLAMLGDRLLLPVEGVNGGERRYFMTDIGLIIWDLIQSTQLLTNGDLGITSGTIQSSRPYTESFKPLVSIQDIIEDLTALDDSVDIAFTPDRQLNIYYPGLGTDKSNELLMSYPGNIVSGSGVWDWSRTANYVLNRGGGNGLDTTPVETRQDATSQQRYGIRMRMDDYPRVSAVQTLRDFGDETLRLDKDGSILPHIRLNGRVEPQLGSYWLGDWVRFSIGDDDFADVDGEKWRINDIQVSVDENHDEDITVTVGQQ